MNKDDPQDFLRIFFIYIYAFHCRADVAFEAL